MGTYKVRNEIETKQNETKQIFSLTTRSRLRLSRVTVQATRGNLYGSLPYSV
jgi:hypothetical protein